MSRARSAILLLALAASGAFAQAPEGRLYTPGSFDRVQIDGAGQVTLSQGDRDEVFVNGGAQMQAAVSVHVSGGRLQLSLPGAWKFWDSSGKAQVEVRMRQVKNVSMSGAGDLVAAGPIRSPQLAVDVSGSGVARFDDLRADKLSFTISGSGEGQLAGRVERLQLSVSGKGKVTAGQLQAGDANVSISGVGNAEVWVTDGLNVDISGAGHVRYRGQPKIRQSISGWGSVEAGIEAR